MRSISLGDVARITLLCLDDTDARESPTGITVVVRPPDYPTTAETTVTSPDSDISLGISTLPLSVREELVQRMSHVVTFTAADLTDGVGCVEFLHTPDQRGRWQYSMKPTAPSVSAETVWVNVTDEFAP